MGFSHIIMQWYEENKRDLPWRHTNDPYRIWVSEVILQQTRVEQGLAYYHRFVERFPDMESLAKAEEEDVIKIWQGLGYYSRARNMHQSARTLYQDNKSKFPASYDEIKRMKGVGDYSASAISSIAFGEVHPVVDGNVLRVAARFMGILEPVNTQGARKKVREILEKLIDPDQPGIFNQAIMELGALVCKPKQPDCLKCPIIKNCFAFRHELTRDLPKITKARPSRIRYFNYLVILSQQEGGDFMWIRKRTGEDIWKNLYDFPLVESETKLTAEEIIKNKKYIEITGIFDKIISPVVETARHLLSHQELRVQFILISSGNYYHPDYLKVKLEDLHNYPVPRLIENILKKITLRPGIFFKFPD